jgi:hypothetical protein
MKKDGLSNNTATNINIGQFDTLISNALGLHKTQLHQKLSDMFDYADDNLISLIETPEPNYKPDVETEDESDHNDNYYNKLIRILRSERNNIESAFFKAINENNNSKDHTQIDNPVSNKLSLIDQDEMDEMVAITAMYSNAMNIYGEEANNLAARLEYIERSSNRMLPKYIFDPKHICEAFQTALKQAEISIDYKLLLFRLFDQDVSSQFGDMYKSLNQLFIDAGVLPEVVYTVNNQASTTHSTGESSLNDTSSQTDITTSESKDSDKQKKTSDNNAPGFHNKISRFLSQFMSGFSTAKGDDIPQSFTTTPSETDSDICYSRNDLMNALSKLQNNLAKVDNKNTPDIDAEHIKRSIIANMGNSNGGAITKTVHTLDQRCIDFVGMIFQAIAEDESISMVITNLLMILQIPIIKTAMLDEELFTETDHPARVTLDLITKAGRGVTENTDRVYIELKRIVNCILHDYDIDKVSFEQAANELKTLIKEEEEISAEIEKVEQQNIIKQHARDVVLGEMRRITINKTIPENTRPLMLKYWPSLMYKYYMNHGIESSEWLSSLKIFNLLIKYQQPIKSKSQWQKLNNNYESLVETVNEELYKIRHDTEEIDGQISALKQTFLKMLDTKQYQFEEDLEEESKQISTNASYDEPDISKTENMQLEDIEHNDKAVRIEEQVRIAREKISRLPTNLHPGVWFEVFNGENKPVRRLKLSVILTDVAKLIFVDRQGVKVIEKDADDFLHELNNKQSMLIADHSTFEHALGSVIHKFA